MNAKKINLTKQKKADTNPLQQTSAYDRQSRAFLMTQNNPADYGLDTESVIRLVHKTFQKNDLIYWCMVEEEGSCRHYHIYCLLGKKKRWSSVQRAFPHAHLESEVKGSPKQCRDYLLKEGDRFKDKAETQIAGTFYEEGELPRFNISADRTAMLLQIEVMLEQGMCPEEIMSQSIVFRQYETLIRKQFLEKRFKETPIIRPVSIRWHLGASGSGKSYAYVKLCEKYGENDVFFANDYANHGASLLDGYADKACRHLFLDELKPDCLRYGFLLTLLDRYRQPIHCRYVNCYSLWTTIDISSIYTPREIYNGMVDINDRDIDSEQQLLRRITSYVYHWKTENGEYHEYEIPASEWTSYDDLVKQATESTEFHPLEGNSPFDQNK